MLAASFTDDAHFEAKGLTEHLRDLAANFLSSSPGDTKLVTNAMIDGLKPDEARTIVRYLGQVIRDQPERQLSGVGAILRLSRRQVSAVEDASKALAAIPPQDLRPGIPVLFMTSDNEQIRNAIEAVVNKSNKAGVREAFELTLGKE